MALVWILKGPVNSGWQLRELTRYWRKLTGLRTSRKDQVHAVLAGPASARCWPR